MQTVKIVLLCALLLPSIRAGAAPISFDAGRAVAQPAFGLSEIRTPEKISWKATVEEALAEAALEYRSVILFVTTPACLHCHRLKQQVLQDEAIVDLLSHFSLVELDASLYPQTAAMHGIRGVPALLFLTSDGRERGRIEGYIARDQLEQVLRSLLSARTLQLANKQEDDLLHMLAIGILDKEQWGDVLAGLSHDRVRHSARELLRAEKDFPREMLVQYLADPRLSVRLGALELLEEAAGDDFGFDPWRAPAAEDGVSHEPWRRWQAWAQIEPDAAMPAYSAMTEEQVEGYLRDLLASDRARSLRAARLLARGGPGMLQALQEFEAGHPDLPEGMRARLREVRYTIQLPAGERVDAAALAHRLVFGQQDTRLQVLRDLALHAARTMPILEEHLLSDEPLVRETAIEAIVSGAGRQGLPALQEHAAREKNVDVLIILIRGLGLIQTREALGVLLPFLEHEQEDVVIATLQAVQRISDRTAEEGVTAALQDERWRVRVAALDAVAALRLGAAAATVEAMLRDEDAYVRYKAVQTISAVSRKGAYANLVQLYQDDDTLKGAVIEALCSLEMNPPGSFAEGFADKDVSVLLGVLEGLRKCERRGVALAAELAAHPDSDVACGALRILGEHGLQQAACRAILLGALESGQRERVLAALESMREADEFWEGGSLFSSSMGEIYELDAEEEPEALDDAMAGLMDAFLGAPPVAAPEPEPTPETPLMDDLFSLFMEAPPASTSPGSAAAPSATRHDLLRAVRLHYEQVEDDPLRFEASMILAKSRDPSVLAYQFESLGRRTITERAELAAVMDEWSDTNALRVVRRLLADSSPQVRSPALYAILSLVARPPWATALFGEVRRENSPLRPSELFTWSLREALQNRAPARQVRRHVERLLDDELSDELTTLGLLLLDGIWRPGDEARASGYLGHENPFVRRAAARALARNNPRRFAEHVDQVGEDVSEHVRIVIPALYSRQGTWVHLLEQGVQASDYFDNRSELFALLFPAQRREVIEAVRTMTEDPSARVRVEAFFALLSRNQDVDVDALLATVQSFSDPSEVGRRIGSFLQDNYSRLDQSYAPLTAYLEYASISRSRRANIVKHFESVTDESSAAVQEAPVRLRAVREWEETPDACCDLDAPPPEEFTPPEIRVVYFEEPGCPECDEAQGYLLVLQDMFPELRIEKHTASHLRGQELLQQYGEQFDVPPEWRMVTPAVFAGGGSLVREDISFEQLSELIIRSMNTALADWHIEAEEAAEEPSAFTQAVESPAARPRARRTVLLVSIPVLLVGFLLLLRGRGAGSRRKTRRS